MFATSSCCKHDITFTSTLVTNSYPVFQAPGKPPTLSSAVCYCTTPLWTNSSWLLFSAEKHKEKCSYHVQWAETITEKVFKRLMNQSGKQWGCSEDLHGSLGIKLSSSLRCLPQDVSRVLSCPQEVTLKPPWCLQMPICMHMARLSLCQRHKCMQINLMDPQISAQRSVCLSHWFITFWTLHGHLHQIPVCVVSPGVRLCSGLKRIFFFSHKLRRSSLWHNRHLRAATDGCHPTGICWSQVYLTPYRSTTSVMDHFLQLEKRRKIVLCRFCFVLFLA